MYTRFMTRFICTMYNSRVDVGTRLRRDLRRVAPFFCATRQELSYSPPFSFHVPSRGEKDDRGARGERHAIAMLEIDQWVFLALLAVRLAAWLRIYCVSIFRGTTIVRSNAFIVAHRAARSCFSFERNGNGKKEDICLIVNLRFSLFRTVICLNT